MAISTAQCVTLQTIDVGGARTQLAEERPTMVVPGSSANDQEGDEAEECFMSVPKSPPMTTTGGLISDYATTVLSRVHHHQHQ